MCVHVSCRSIEVFPSNGSKTCFQLSKSNQYIFFTSNNKKKQLKIIFANIQLQFRYFNNYCKCIWIFSSIFSGDTALISIQFECIILDDTVTTTTTTTTWLNTRRSPTKTTIISICICIFYLYYNSH